MKRGDRFERYQIVELVGRGAMGQVFRAKDTVTLNDVALKVVEAPLTGEDRDIIEAERFGAELQRRLNLADNRVVRVNRFGDLDGSLFVDMEYVDGQDVAAALARGPLDAKFAAYVARELCQTLENLRAFKTTIGTRHFCGVIHGDLKPRNVRLDRRNAVRVMDFGIAKALSDTRNETVNLFASTAYCSPERLESGKMDSHSDLWSVGVLLYQMVSGRLPFDDENRMSLERRICSGGGPDPLPESCPEPLRQITAKMLARELCRRYQTAAEVNDDLARFQTGHFVVVPEVVVPENDATVRTAAPAREFDAERTRRTVQESFPRMTPVAAVPIAVTPRRRPGRLLMATVTLALLYTIAKIGFGPAVALLFGLAIGAGAAWWWLKPREFQR
ncbi:serine/threonine protein kinase [Nevskia soli]|uniref:serine/threonine protein kinase n=1 Tax=Nevskia soli TaxID=418856 RepID=UPI0015D7DF03|nr:serine/threonine-protein kinase [Nevskia soli]